MKYKNIFAAARRLKRLKDLFKSKKQLQTELDEHKRKLATYELGWPPGHFYSPIASLEAVKKREAIIWGESQLELPGITLFVDKQLLLLSQLSAYYSLHPWEDKKRDGLRFYFDNPNFSHGESIILFCLMMHFKPKKIIEIGSGHSSCALYDTNELFFNNVISITFIEPYPQLLLSLLKESDAKQINLIPENLQITDINVFRDLSAGDFLIIDSTHVSKVDSDVNYILFKILPALKSGVYIHFHDIYFPFEYPKEWIYQGRSWNEAYILHAFLQYNKDFEIVLFNSMIGFLDRKIINSSMPLFGKYPGSSLWIRKL